MLATHQRLLREAFAHHGGHEVDTQGDAFFVAFANARDAVLAAVEGQRALAAHSWPDGAAVKVRMGIHTGQASPADGRYTGVAVHRAARIGAAAHGGQVLVSQATHTLLEDEEEDLGIELRDLGSQPLKGLDRPVHLYQVAAPGLPTQFPPLRGEEDAKAVAVARPRHGLRRPWFLLVAGALLVIGTALSAVLLSRGGGGGGLSLVHPNNVGVIDPTTNRIVDEVQVGIRPGPIAAGEGSVWVGNIADRNLTRVDYAPERTRGAVSLNNQTPTGLAVGAGAVWVAHGLLGRLSRVDPRTGLVTTTIDVALPSLSGEVTVGGGRSGRSTVGRPLRASIPSCPGCSTKDWPAMPDRNRVRERGRSGSSTAASRTCTASTPPPSDAGASGPPISVGERPAALAFGDGAIWVANGGDDSVTRIDAASYSTSTIPDVGHGPVAIAFGAGAVWVASSDGTVARIDPGTRRVVKTIPVGNVPSGIVVAGGLAWVTVQAP